MTLIYKEKLIADINAAKKANKKVPIMPFIEKAEPVETDSKNSTGQAAAGWISVDTALPEEDGCKTFVLFKRPFGGTEVGVATYKASGFYNGGRNKWSCEPVVGAMAGCKVLYWMLPPEKP